MFTCHYSILYILFINNRFHRSNLAKASLENIVYFEKFLILSLFSLVKILEKAISFD